MYVRIDIRSFGTMTDFDIPNRSENGSCRAQHIVMVEIVVVVVVVESLLVCFVLLIVVIYRIVVDL